METVKSVSHQQVVKLLHNKFVVVLGDSIQRAVYKDLVLLLQKDKYLLTSQLRSKGEESFEQDCLVEGGSFSQLHNGTEYREVRQYQSEHHLLRFYFITRIYSSYMSSVLSDFRRGPKPDVVIVNSCVWDISRYNCKWIEEYKENLQKFFDELKEVLPMETLVIWNVTMPLAKKIRGGFLVAEIEHKVAQLRSDVIEANFYSGTLADRYGLDVLDLHFQFRFSQQHRAKDGVHWNAIAHRRISWLLLQHMAQAWGVTLPRPLTAVENRNETQQIEKKRSAIPRVEAPISFHYPPNKYFTDWGSVVSLPVPTKLRGSPYREDFYSDSTTAASPGYLSFEEPPHWSNSNHEAAGGYDSSRLCLRRTDAAEERNPYVMKRRHRHHYAPYSYHRPQHYNQCNQHNQYQHY